MTNEDRGHLVGHCYIARRPCGRASVKQEHSHAHILRAIADGETVQMYEDAAPEHTGWFDQTTPEVLRSIARVGYPPDRFRIKPATFVLAGIEVPMPLREEPPQEGRFFLADFFHVHEYKWCGVQWQKRKLAQHFIHATRESAELHSKALRKAHLDAINGGTE